MSLGTEPNLTCEWSVLNCITTYLYISICLWTFDAYEKSGICLSLFTVQPYVGYSAINELYEHFKINHIYWRNDWCLYVLMLISVKTKLAMDVKSFDLGCSLGMENDSLSLSPFLNKLFREVCSFDTPTSRHITLHFDDDLSCSGRIARQGDCFTMTSARVKLRFSFPFSLINCPSFFCWFYFFFYSNSIQSCDDRYYLDNTTLWQH